MRITCPPGVLVPDISKYNHHLNMSELIQGGVKAVILGFYKKWVPFKWVLDDNCKRLADQVATSGIPLMSYFYYYVQNNPVADADWFINAMRPYPVKYAWSDCEDVTPGFAKSFYSEQARKFELQLTAQFLNSGVYSAKWYVETFGTYLDADGHQAGMDTWLPHYQTWIAHYRYRPSLATTMSWEEFKANWLPNYDVLATSGMLPNKFMGHQFTGDRCMLPGVYDEFNRRQPLDVSVFLAEFIASLGSGTMPPVPPIPPASTYTNYVITSWQLNVRIGPGIGYGIAYKKVQGEILKVASIDMTNGYVRLTDGNWVYFSYLQKV